MSKQKKQRFQTKPAVLASPSFFRELKLQFSEAIKSEERLHIYTFLVILGLAIINRLYFLFQPMRYDEAFCFLRFASQPLSVGLSDYSFPNNHILHTFLEHISFSMLGEQPWALRLPALLAGILMVPASYLLTRIFYNKQAALLTAGFVAASSTLIEYSTNARGYSLFCLITLLLFTLGAFLIKTNSVGPWMLFSILSALGFFTIPTMLYPFGISVLWLFMSGIFNDSSLSRGVLIRNIIIYSLIAAIFTLILYAPVLSTSGLQSIIGNRFLTPLLWPAFLEKILSSFISAWKIWSRDIPFIVQVVGVIGFMASLILHSRLSNFKIPIILPVAIWIPLVLVLQKVAPYARGWRIWLFLLPLYFMLASCGLYYILSALSKKTLIFSVLVVALSISLSFNVIKSRSVYYSNETGTLREAQELTLFFKDYLQRNDRVLALCPSDAPLEYYFKLHSVPTDYLKLSGNIHQRLLVVVNKSHEQTLEGVLQKAGIRETNLNTTRLKEYQFATLYELKTKRPE